jgi:hypothetical protein
MSDGDDIEMLRAATVHHLRTALYAPRLATVREYVEKAEDTVLGLVNRQLGDLVSISTHFEYKTDGNALADSDGHRYLVTTIPASNNPSILCVTLIPLGREDVGERVRRSRAVSFPGRFRRIDLMFPHRFANLATIAVEQVKTILDSGYSFISAKIIEAVDNTEVEVAKSLYSLASEIFPEEILRREVWFATVGPVYGFRLMSAEAARAALQTIDSNTRGLPVSPLDLVAELLATRLPREVLLMNVAAADDVTIDVDVSDAGYTKSRSRYAFVLTSFYGGTSFTIMPLLRSDQFAVMALFPTGKPLLQNRIEQHREELERRAREVGAAIVEAASLFEISQFPAALPGDQARNAGNDNLGIVLGATVDEIRSKVTRSKQMTHRDRFMARLRTWWHL